MNTPPAADGPEGRYLDPMSYFVPYHNTHSTSLAAHLIQKSEGHGGAGNRKNNVQSTALSFRNASSQVDQTRRVLESGRGIHSFEVRKSR